MYSVCTFRLGREFGVPFLNPLGEAFAWIALMAWSAAAIGLIRRLAGASPSPGAGRVLAGERGK
jgi:hypothetical protein